MNIKHDPMEGIEDAMMTIAVTQAQAMYDRKATEAQAAVERAKAAQAEEEARKLGLYARFAAEARAANPNATPAEMHQAVQDKVIDYNRGFELLQSFMKPERKSLFESILNIPAVEDRLAYQP